MAQTLAELIAGHAGATPDKLALSDGLRTWTFAELERQANAGAQALVNLGVSRGDRVAVFADRSGWVVAWALAAWKAGAIYAPIDPQLPDGRLGPLLERLAPKAIIGSADSPCVRASGAVKAELDAPQFAGPAEPQSGEVAPSDLAIIIHTSGSTGIPKGVCLEHASVLAYFDSHREVLRQTSESRCLNTASFHYDVSIQDTFLPLSTGAYVRLCRELFVPDVVLPLIAAERITQITAVSTVLAMISGNESQLARYDLNRVACISTGAEVCNVELIHAWLRRVPGLRVLNGYGPSEVNSVTVTHVIDRVDEGRRKYYPIGTPHRGVLAKLVRENGTPITRPNERGQLLLGGPQLMRGYFRNPEATAAAFCWLDGEKYYQTGDYCYYDDAGLLVFDGRADFEVKLNGRRLNLGEVCEVVERWTPYDGAICGLVHRAEKPEIGLIVRVASDTGADRDQVQAVLEKHFPAYMRPRVFGTYAGAVQTGSGKTDGRTLLQALGAAYSDSGATWFEWEGGRFAPAAPQPSKRVKAI